MNNILDELIVGDIKNIVDIFRVYRHIDTPLVHGI